MNAIEAREKAIKFNLSVNGKEIKDIDNLIEQAAKKGEFSFDYYKQLTKPTIKHFEDIGFKIGYKTCGPNEYLHCVSW